jgi:hypothetical protein
LVRQLSHPSWHVREKAQDRLAELGGAAEPQLRQARAAGDSQTRLGAERVLQQIAAARKLGPTLVSLHVEGAPPQKVFEDLSRQAHVPILPAQENLWGRREWPPLTLDLDGRPFWEAMRRACAAAGLRPLYVGGDEEPGRIVLAADVTGDMKSPAAFSGSFMVLATGVTRRIPTQENAAASDVELQCTFYGDPKWRILSHPDEVKIDQVVDGHGRPLGRPEPMRLQVFKPQSPVWMMRTVVPAVPLTSRTLGRVKGSFTITLLEQGEPVEVPDVQSARNVVLKAGRQMIQVHEVAREGNRTDTYRVTLTLSRNGLSERDWRQAREAEGICLFDAKGRGLTRSWFEAKEGGEQVAYNLFYTGGGNPGMLSPPARLVCRVPLEPREVTVSFELTGLAIEQ